MVSFVWFGELVVTPPVWPAAGWSTACVIATNPNSLNVTDTVFCMSTLRVERSPPPLI
jgi:hypothetical protein